MTDLTKNVTPWQYLPAETREAFMAHSGQIMVLDVDGDWDKKKSSHWFAGEVYRAKPAPRQPRERWIGFTEDGVEFFFDSYEDAEFDAPEAGWTEIIRVREVMGDE